jgi:hypothetical protein
VRNDIIEHQLAKAGLPSQQPLQLALMLVQVKATGEYKNAVREWDNKTPADKTFANFCPFITMEFAKRNKAQDNAKGAGHRIANAATALQEQQLQHNHAAKTALAYATLTEAMKENQKESMEQMLKMFKDILKNVPGTGNGNGAANPTNTLQRTKCPHSNL